MYFPYLRGKQFELIALREICSFIDNKFLISPIIEPVKETTVTLEKTIDCLIKNNINFNLIINPKIGEIKNVKVVLDIIKTKLKDYNNFQPTILISQSSKFVKIYADIKLNGLTNLTVICKELPDDEDAFFNFIKNKSIKYVVLNEDLNSKRFTRAVKSTGVNLVTLSDSFNVLKRNADYLVKDNEFFSDEHMFYKEEGFIGYADYTTIGREYSDTGFLPYAIAIHLTYFNDKEEIWIRHFVSDSNEDTTDVAGKFSEAIKKLVGFLNKKDIHTQAAEEFRNLHESESYSGLGNLKKLSVKHHIEMIYEYLNKI